MQRRGLLARAPAEVVEHLVALHALNAERNALLRRELVRAARVCNALGVESLLLKGALALLPGQRPETAARLLGDLDLLLPTEAVAAGQQALQDRLGYRPAYPDWRFAEHHHACPLIHPDHGAKFELHRAVLGGSLAATLPAEEVWRDSQRIGVEEAFVRAPSFTHRVLHNLLHTLVRDRRAESGVLELRQLFDLVQFRARDDARIDWPLIRARCAAGGHNTALSAYLLVARDLFGQPPPAGFSPSIAAVGLANQLVLGVRHPAMTRWCHWQQRLQRLPKRLGTPSWYALKIRALWRGEPL